MRIDTAKDVPTTRRVRRGSTDAEAHVQVALDEECEAMAHAHESSDQIPRMRYFTTTFLAEDGEYGAGTWYAEFSDGIPRRQFEVYAQRVLVAPYDLSFADQYQAILSDAHYREIALAEFENAWNRFAARRLKELAEM
jgi:hypothetical protein